MEGDVILLQEVFKFDENRGHISTGIIPHLFHELKNKGVIMPIDIFKD